MTIGSDIRELLDQYSWTATVPKDKIVAILEKHQGLKPAQSEHDKAIAAQQVSAMAASTIPFVQAELRVQYGVDENGKQVVATTYTADGVTDSIPDYFTGIVMLETSKIDFLHRHGIMVHREELP